MSDTECPTCERADFKNQRGVEVHHAMAHDESLTEVTYTCEVCGDESTAPRAWAKKNPLKYCSDDCKNEAMRVPNAPERECANPECDTVFAPPQHNSHLKFCSPACVYGNRSSDGKTRLTNVCEWCGEDYGVRPGRADTRRFCSPECSAAWQSDALSGRDHPNWDRVEVHCGWCGAPKFVTQHRYDRLDNHFCNQGCWEKWEIDTDTNEGKNSAQWVERSVAGCEHCDRPYQPLPFREDESRFCSPRCFRDHQKGENHPCWEGGPAPYGEGWTKAKRESVRESQNRRCAGCGTHESSLYRKLDVHHIVPAREFDDPTKRNAESNLVAMCQSCHVGKWEGIPLAPQVVET